MGHKRIKVMANKTELTQQAKDESRPRSHTCDLTSHNMFELKPHFEVRASFVICAGATTRMRSVMLIWPISVQKYTGLVSWPALLNREINIYFI